MKCPHCHKKAVEMMRDECMNETDPDGSTIEIVYRCGRCKEESVMRFEFEGWYDENDFPINEVK